MRIKGKKLAFIAALGFMLSCGGGSGSGDSNDDAQLADGVDNVLAISYPMGLEVALFPTNSDKTSLALAENSFKKRQENAKNLLNGTSDSCLASVFSRQDVDLNETCYEFDQGQIYGQRGSSGFLGNLDGKSTSGSGEACVTSFVRSQTNRVESAISRALGIAQAALCQAKKDNPDAGPPAEVGETLSLNELLAKALGDKASKISDATMKRINDFNGRKVYRTDFTVNFSDNVSREVHIVHSPVNDKNEEYSGKIWIKVVGDEESQANRPDTTWISIQYKRYKKDDQYYVDAEAIRARFKNSVVSNPISNGVLNLNSGAKFDDPANLGKWEKSEGGYYDYNEVLSGITYIGFSMNKDNGSGQFTYGNNPGGNYNENYRGMTASTTADENGLLSGCAITGASSDSPNNSISIRKAQRETDVTMDLRGFYHPFFNTEDANCPATQGSDSTGSYYQTSCNGGGKWYVPRVNSDAYKTLYVTKQMGSILERQCFKQNDSGLYVIDTDKITDQNGFELIDSQNDADKLIKAVSLSFDDISVE